MTTSPRKLLKAWNLSPKKSLGQCFLSDPSTAATIIARANFSSRDVVLEIGAGLGALTIPLAKAVRKLYAVEKDLRLIGLLKTELLVNRIANCEIIAGDILKVDMRTLSETAGGRITVIGNLPYNLSSQILVHLIESRDSVERAVLMFQKELSRRIAALPGNRDYGRITAMLRYCADIRPLAKVKATVFYPPPKVDSEVIEITFKSTSAAGSREEAMLFSVIQAAFGNRRKMLKNALTASSLKIDSQTAVQALIQAGIDPSRRAETLEPAEFVALEIALRKAMAKE